VRRLFADTTPLRTPDFRRLWLSGLFAVVAAPAFVRYRVAEKDKF
jgi:hypothetical protein